jgi:hypothetical protein
MTISATEGVPSASPLVADGKGDEGEPRAVLALLDTDVYRDPRWCEHCESLEEFVEFAECGIGRGGFCRRCGKERVIRFSRAVA